MRIQELMDMEAGIRTRCKNDSEERILKADVINLLDSIGANYEAIHTYEDLDWVCSAIVRWDSFLRWKFRFFKKIPLPSATSLPHLKDEEIPAVTKKSKAAALFGDLNLRVLRSNKEYSDPPIRSRFEDGGGNG